MIPEIGQLALVLALFLALAQTVFPLVGAAIGRTPWMGVAVPAAAGQFTFVVLAFGCLAASFLGNDFSVLNVATNSNSKLPEFFRLAATWGSHEGSLLLWALILATWTMAVCTRQHELPPALAARMLGVMGAISVGFLAFILFTSNPFERLAMIPADGNDLNPLLQDVAMIAHPPMLYMGYVGFVVAFAYAVAALLTGRVEREWVRWIRPWTTSAWLFLTVGIALGSWWAYYELGWGGWWFWDPVENASFMPWLVGTALIHSLAVTEKRGIFLGTTLLLAITAFSLSLVGTFLVRSGVLVSVHAFASDPTRGLFILAFLGIVIGTALGLYAWRAPSLDQPRGFKPLSRETFLLVNNLLLCVAAGLVFLGTVYPLVLDALDQGKISVGPPYFETAFIIPMLPLVFAVGVGMHTAWRSADAGSLWRKLRWLALVAVIAGIAVPTVVYGGNSALTAAGVAAGLWLVLSALADPVRALLKRGPAVTRSALGMNVAHLGLGLFVLGVTVTSSFTIETDQKISPGGTATVGEYTIRFDSLREVQGPNYQALQGTMTIQRGDRIVGTVYPEKRAYFVRSQPMTEAGIDGTIGRDLFVALGDDLGAGAWSVRIQYKPLIRFIWLGCLVMAIGGLLAATDRRYRFARVQETAPARGELATGAAGS